LTKRSINTRVSRMFAGVAAVLCLGFGLATSAEAQGATKLKLAYIPLSGAAVHFIAKDHGIFEKHGLDVELVFTRSAAEAIPGLISNSVQIAMLPASSLVQAADGDLDIVALTGNLSTRTETQEAAFLASQDSGIRSVADIKGKKIALISIGSISQVLFEKWLQQKGVDRQTIATVQYAEVSLPQHADVIRSGTVDGAVSVAPFISAILSQGRGVVISYFMGEMPDRTPTMLNAASRRWAESNGKTVAAFRAAMVEATDYGLKHPDETNAMLVKWLKLKPEIVAASRFPDLTTEIDPARIQWWIDTLAEQGRLKNKLDPDRLILK
jgi:NitT/TauT family transport system substrate-binding protein